MVTAFSGGDTVRARASAQRLVQGTIYIVTNVERLPFECVRYTVEERIESAVPISVMNGHLLLERVVA